MQFHNKEGVIPYGSPNKVFILDQEVTLFLDTQNNSNRGESSTIEATNLEHIKPVSDTAFIFIDLCQHYTNPDNPICSYFPTTGAATQTVIITNSFSLIHFHASNIGFQCLGFYPHEIGSHLICSGGAMNLHQFHIPNSTIRIIL